MLATETAALLPQDFTLGDPDLKRVPAPYQGETSSGRKSVILWFDPPEAQWRAPTDVLLQRFRQLAPTMSWLRTEL